MLLLLLGVAAARETALTARDRQVLEKARLIDRWFEERRARIWVLRLITVRRYLRMSLRESSCAWLRE